MRHASLFHPWHQRSLDTEKERKREREKERERERECTLRVYNAICFERKYYLRRIVALRDLLFEVPTQILLYANESEFFMI